MPPPSRPCKSLVILHEKPLLSILHFRDCRPHQGHPAENVSASPKRPESRACARHVADWAVQNPGCGIALDSVLPAYPVGNPSARWKFPGLRRVDDQFSTISVDKPTAAGILRVPTTQPTGRGPVAEFSREAGASTSRLSVSAVAGCIARSTRTGTHALSGPPGLSLARGERAARPCAALTSLRRQPESYRPRSRARRCKLPRPMPKPTSPTKTSPAMRGYSTL